MQSETANIERRIDEIHDWRYSDPAKYYMPEVEQELRQLFERLPTGPAATAAPTLADYKDGVAAYNRGD